MALDAEEEKEPRGGSDRGFYGLDFGVGFAALPQLQPWRLGFGVGVRTMLGMVCVPSVGTDVVQPLERGEGILLESSRIPGATASFCSCQRQEFSFQSCSSQIHKSEFMEAKIPGPEPEPSQILPVATSLPALAVLGCFYP